MALVTPRRKFLITAPLALLLPAGLLTYLGLGMVRGVESRWERRAEEVVSNIVSSVRDRAARHLGQKITTPFRYTFQNQTDTLLPNPPLPEETSFEVNENMPFASQIFFYGIDGQLYFFERVKDHINGGSKWILTPSSPSIFTTRLKSDIDTEIETSIEIYDRDPPSDEGFPFQSLAYPDDLYPPDTQRELAFFFIINPIRPQPEMDIKDPSKPGYIAVGFTFNFDYLNDTFFNTILEEMWDYPGELRYPITIVDRVTQEPVGLINNTNYSAVNRSKYIPRSFSNDFPWYRIHFSRYIEDDIMGFAKNEKIVYYCLIATANLIMIVGVVGALRNILHELALADMRSNFVARVSHELRTPLGLIRLSAETLELGRIKSDEKRNEYLHSITKESERLTHLINNILDFSQIEAHKKDYAFVQAPLEDIVYDSADSMRYHIERHGLQLEMNVEPDLPSISCDPEALQQAFYNLLSNAMKYTGEGKTITVNAFQTISEAIIEVSDEGIGIAPDQQRKIFQEFYRVDDPLVRETGGSGLGLAVVKHIVEGHNGYIRIKSSPGKGSTFSIHLPLKRKK